jgi:hypothetical protein
MPNISKLARKICILVIFPKFLEDFGKFIEQITYRKPQNKKILS